MVTGIGKWSVLVGMALMAGVSSAAESTRWQFEFRYDIVGVKQSLPAVHSEQCLASSIPLVNISKPGYECRSRSPNWFGKTLIWQIDCSNGWESIQGTGRLHFADRRAHGDIHLQILTPTGGPDYIAVDIQGQQLGACRS